ncbi:hypothetical protein AAG906_035717 [Vitis piasezkii]
MASSSTQAPSSSIPPWSHDVFLSFRGKDTPLVANAIHTFRDDEELDRGAPGLLKSIEQSRISIVIFSENYADSRWCSDEVIKIIEYRELWESIYGVRKDVSKENREKVERWRAALKEAINLSGWHLHDHLEKVDLSVHWKDKRMKPLFTFHCPWIRGGGARHLLSSSLGGRHALGEDYWTRSAALRNLL